MANKNDDDFKFDPIPFMVGANIGFRHGYKKQERRNREEARRHGYDYDGYDGGSGIGGILGSIVAFLIVFFLVGFFRSF